MDTSAVLLVGGQGTRLRRVISSTPKPLAPVGGESFLALLVRQLRSQGIARLVMCTGYMSEQIEKEFGDGQQWDIKVEYSRESKPLGTAGALKQAESLLRDSKAFVVMNGDSFLELDFRELLRFHCERNGIASLAVVRVPDAARYGTVFAEDTGRIARFVEKTGVNVAGLINAGVYVFDQDIFKHIPDGPASLENDVFPKILSCGAYAFEVQGMFVDIGTPEDYARAQTLCKRLSHTTLGEA
jgi:NDP-sugar pyrophosphorylase family protein